MSLTFKLTRNDISPALTRLARQASNPAAVLRAMGTTFKSITEGTFNSAGQHYRPMPWPRKRDGSPSILQKSTTLAKSFRLEVSGTYARLSTATIYGRVHQFSAVIRPKRGPFLSWVGADGKRIFARKVTIPARPFFPVDASGKLIPAAEQKIAAAGERALARQQ